MNIYMELKIFEEDRGIFGKVRRKGVWIKDSIMLMFDRK